VPKAPGSLSAFGLLSISLFSFLFPVSSISDEG
jgi:hypothetical protein